MEVVDNGVILAVPGALAAGSRSKDHAVMAGMHPLRARDEAMNEVRAAARAGMVAQQQGVSLQQATLQVVGEIAQGHGASQKQIEAMWRHLTTIEGRLGRTQGQMRQQLPSGRGNFNAFQ